MKTTRINTESNKKNEVKAIYEKPMIEIIEMETEGILCGSDTSGDDYKPGGGDPWL